MSNINHDIEWMVAALAPWAISPHPNFSENAITRVSELALVTERRDQRELDRYKVEEVQDGQEWQVDLVKAARESLFEETQESSTESLWRLALDARLPLGARVSAALYGSLGLTELELPSVAAARLLELFEQLSERKNPNDHSSSARLGIAAVLQQRVARLEDACGYTEARLAVESVLEWLPLESEAFDYDFPVSQGISWSASKVQKDVAASLRYHALASKAHLEQLSGDTWVQVVRGRGSWVDERLNSRVAERDGMMLRDSFETTFESTTGTRYLMRDVASEKGYAALLVAELAGHTSRIRSCREALAKVLLLEDHEDVHSAREALRLLRQSRATKSLQSALKWIRSQGPTAALVADATTVISRASSDRWVTEADLSVMEAAADFLAPQDLSRAIKATFLLSETEQLSGRADWAVQDKIWKTLARLVPGSGEDDFIARRAAQHLANPKLLAEPFSSTLAKVVESIDWASVGPEAIKLWKGWITSETEAKADVDELRSISAHFILGGVSNFGTLKDLERAAFLADNGLPSGENPEIIDEARSSIIAALAAEIEGARTGVLSFGGLSSSNVASAFAFRFADKEVWIALSDFLTNPLVDAVFKEKALDRLASRAQEIPDPVKKALRHKWTSVIEGARSDHFFGPKPLPVFAAAVRLGSALKIMSHSDSLSSVLRLAASDDPARVEAARTIPSILSSDDATWGHVMLLQLARDKHPEVRAEAGHSLVLSLRQNSEITHSVKARIIELIASDGIRVPLRIIHAIQMIAPKHSELLQFVKPELVSLDQDGSPRIIRSAAREALARIEIAGSKETTND
ncbi:hypothetical protein [Pseudarthrobacter sp. C4D7]|uniref:hypothetical protein n=1 Tax=Pseudarthrobacter sp. C4D7 TaxID=2735268 RepID=UPI0015856270|nr:hypothetical protein [Pseudarthrobacter sp. C4D7]NUT70414.1 hypothetical protein [Pseudarthrobacter sp. C4D7]